MRSNRIRSWCSSFRPANLSYFFPPYFLLYPFSHGQFILRLFLFSTYPLISSLLSFHFSIHFFFFSARRWGQKDVPLRHVESLPVMSNKVWDTRRGILAHASMLNSFIFYSRCAGRLRSSIQNRRFSVGVKSGDAAKHWFFSFVKYLLVDVIECLSLLFFFFSILFPIMNIMNKGGKNWLWK